MVVDRETGEMSIPLSVACGFNTIPIKILMLVVTEIEEL